VTSSTTTPWTSSSSKGSDIRVAARGGCPPRRGVQSGWVWDHGRLSRCERRRRPKRNLRCTWIRCMEAPPLRLLIPKGLARRPLDGGGAIPFLQPRRVPRVAFTVRHLTDSTGSCTASTCPSEHSRPADGAIPAAQCRHSNATMQSLTQSSPPRRASSGECPGHRLPLPNGKS